MSRNQTAVNDVAVNGVPDARALVIALLPPVLLSLVVWFAAGLSHLLAHTLAELFSVVVAITALVVASSTRHFTRNHFFVFVSVAIGWCAGLDLLHLVSYKGMHLLATDSGNLPIQFWIAARLMQGVAMAMAPIMLSRSVRAVWLHAMFGSASVVMFVAIVTGHFPDAYIDGQGLTTFKVYSEYVVMALLGLSLLFIWYRRSLITARTRWSISASVLAMMASEFVLTQYVTLDDNLILMGHLLKIVAYWFVYVALIRTTLSEPFSMLSRAASSYDAVPDPAYVVSQDGEILQANLAAGRVHGLPAANLVGKSAHALLHDAQTPLALCPVCSQLGQARTAFLKLLPLNDHHVVECHVAPFVALSQHQPVWVMLVRDVSERERLSRERDNLVHELQERVKELMCFYELAQLCKTTHASMPDLIKRTVELLPMAFTDAERLVVHVQSIWGQVGEPVPTQMPTLQATMEHAGEPLGTLTVAYRTDPWFPAPELSVAEKCLLDCVALLLSDAYARLHSQARVRRLTYLYDMLSATNRAITHCQTQGELIQMLRSVLVGQGAFDKLFIAVSDADHPSTRMYVDFQQGVDEAQLPLLNALVAQVQHTVLSEQDGRISGKVITRDLSPPLQQSLPSLMAWEGYLLGHGIRQWAAMPILCEGRLWGLVGLCPGGALQFDTEQVRLLEEMAVDLAFSLEHFAIERRRELAEMVSRSLGDRFTTVFQHSPVPMQIVSLYDGKLRVINQAHEHWLGYTLQDIPDAETWFEKAYPDLAQRAALMADWATSLARAQAGETVQSPELTLRDKAGHDHIAQGTVTVVNDDIIIAWTDLTAARHNEQALRDSEQRFRSMVENTVTGMYVRRDGKFLYVNPRYCEILGWTAEELVGRSVLDFTSPDDANLARIRQAWQQLEEPGHPIVSYTVPVRCKGGRMVELGLQARVITWDDGLPAAIVMAQDITERKQAEDKIANYVKQLEASMSGTLQAVANMVEMRDPYTAGHERRVGLIACALAMEMGWREPRAKSLEQLGLVHDIGKIAVPSEILTKPTRLSPIEYELIKGHVDAGYEILKHIPFPTPVADIIRQHHERMDGSGYPLGLKGDAILPEARILAVADVIESMASHRPYRPALGLDVALAEVEKGRGRLYDPEVCDAVLRLIKDKGYVLPT